MAIVVGRSPESRTIATVGTTNTSTAITGPAGAFHVSEDVGRTITGTGIPANATITAVASATAATISATATATGSITATVGAQGTGTYGFFGWSPETDAESQTYTFASKAAGATDPGQFANATTARTHRERY